MKRVTFPVAAHVFFVRADTVLLIRRVSTGFEDGNYSLPSGHLEEGESPRQAACRECREEIGVQLTPDELIFSGVAQYRSPLGDGIDFFFRATRWQGAPSPCLECDQVRWCSLDALPQNTIPFVRRAIRWFLQAGPSFDEQE
jgi:8-oxo-dGTP diphosphatase